MTNKEFAERLVKRIEHHRDFVADPNTQAGIAYKLAHDHIIELIKIEAEYCEEAWYNNLEV